MFERLQAKSWESPVRATVHNLAVDAYSMQHPDDYCKSVKSYVTHLTALCCALEAAGDPNLYWGIPRWLDGPTHLQRPDNIMFRGSMTIADVAGISDEDYPEAVRTWARAVWAAYQGQQESARQWLQEVRRHATGTGAGARSAGGRR